MPICSAEDRILCQQEQQEELEVLRALYPGENELSINEEDDQKSPPRVRVALDVKEGEGLKLHPSGCTAKNLPPVLLDVATTEAYPLHEPPTFRLSCLWLSKTQLTVLCELLDRAWNDYVGSPIISVWCDVISSATLDQLGLQNCCVDLEAVATAEPAGTRLDARAVCLGEGEDAAALAMDVLRHSSLQEHKQFLVAHHTCGVCLSEKLGQHFKRLECGHNFCTECLGEFASVYIKEGDVLAVKCPEPSCRAPLPPSTVKAVVAPCEFERWERLLLQKSLDAMADLVYCPRCDGPVIEESANHLGVCPECFFSFCGLCRQSFHPGKCVSAADRLELLKARTGGSNTAAAAAERQRQVELLNQEAKSVRRVETISKPCPRCHQAIEKTEGCQKVKCSCGTAMCYTCGTDITELGYDHFGSNGCVLFVNEEIDRIAREEAAGRAGGAGAVDNGVLDVMRRLQPNIALNIARCPRCRQRILKEQRNNHMRCWSCQTHFCFICNGVVTKTSAHFTAGRCRQHTD